MLYFITRSMFCFTGFPTRPRKPTGCVCVSAIYWYLGNVKISLLCTQSTVSRVKLITIPNLELYRAHLLARLVGRMVESLYQIMWSWTVLYWSDSTIGLAWLKASPNVLKIFVGNRVAEIQWLIEQYNWRHVPSYDNSADLISRGLLPNKILSSNLWWHGPDWLLKHETEWPVTSTI